MSLKIAAPMLALGLAVGAGVAYLVRPSASTEETESARRAELEIAALRQHVTKLEMEKADALQSNAAILAAAAKSPPTPPPSQVSTPPTPPAAPEEKPDTAPVGARFALAGYEEALKGLDWAVIGKNMREMPALTAAFAESYTKTGNLDPDQIGRLQQLNGPLVTAALKINKALNRDNANTAFTHPAFMANAIAATLEAAGLPLTEAQAKSIERLATDAAAEEDRRLRAYDDNAWALQKVIDDSEARERYFAAVFALLTPEQVAILVPAATKGRMQIDLFTSALIWIMRAGPLPFTDREAMIAAMEKHELSTLALGEGKRAAVHDAVVEWANALPREIRDAARDPLAEKGFLPVGLVIDAAKRTIFLRQRIIDVGSLDDAAAKRIRAGQSVAVPIKFAPEEPK